MTIRDDILNFIAEETEKSIQEKRLDFENCNASFLSQVIYQDRTNVSRILNQLFREEILIKKIGRPTVFISKEVLHNNYPFANFPNIIDKDVKLDKYIGGINQNKKKNSFTQSFHIIGSSQDGSLHNGINQLMSIFFYPQNILKLIILKGEDGSGKKYILQELFNRCIQLGMIESKKQIIYLNIGDFCLNLTKKFKNENIKSIVIQLHKDTTPSKIIEIKQIFEIEYFNQDEKPLLCFLYPNTEENPELPMITPLYIEIPSFVARPAVEQLDLTISFLKKEAERFQKKIKVSKNFIETLIENSSNIDTLQQNTTYLISRYFFNVRSEEDDIILDYDLISNCLQNISKNESNIDLQNIPETFTIEPFEQVRKITQNVIQEKHPITSWAPNATQNYLYYLQNTSDQITLHEIYKGKIYHAITKIFEKRVAFCDINTKNRIMNILLDIIFNNGNFSELFFNLPSVSGLTTQVINISENIEKCLNELDFKLSIKQSYWIRNLLSHSFFVFNEYTIPIVFISEKTLVNQSVQTIFNVYYKNHSIFTYHIHKDSIDKELASLTKFTVSIDKGKGVLLLTDKDVRQKIAEHFFSSTKVSAYTISYSSFPLIIECIKEFKKSNKSLLTLTPELILKNSKLEKMFNEERFSTYSARATNDYILNLKNIYPNINTYEMNESIFSLLKSAVEALQIPLTNNLIFNFIFHMNALISVKKIKYNPEFINSTYCKDETFEMVMRQLISKNEKIKQYNFSSGDIEYLRQVLTY